MTVASSGFGSVTRSPASATSPNKKRTRHPLSSTAVSSSSPPASLGASSSPGSSRIEQKSLPSSVPSPLPGSTCLLPYTCYPPPAATYLSRCGPHDPYSPYHQHPGVHGSPYERHFEYNDGSIDVAVSATAAAETAPIDGEQQKGWSRPSLFLFLLLILIAFLSVWWWYRSLSPNARRRIHARFISLAPSSRSITVAATAGAQTARRRKRDVNLNCPAEYLPSHGMREERRTLCDFPCEEYGRRAPPTFHAFIQGSSRAYDDEEEEEGEEETKETLHPATRGPIVEIPPVPRFRKNDETKINVATGISRVDQRLDPTAGASYRTYEQ